VKLRRVTEITMQTDEAVVLRRKAGSAQVVCRRCKSAVPMVKPEEAAALFRVAVRLIYREIESGQVHFQETSSGAVLVCLDSLQKIDALQSGNSTLQINKHKEIES